MEAPQIHRYTRIQICRQAHTQRHIGEHTHTNIHIHQCTQTCVQTCKDMRTHTHTETLKATQTHTYRHTLPLPPASLQQHTPSHPPALGPGLPHQGKPAGPPSPSILCRASLPHPCTQIGGDLFSFRKGDVTRTTGAWGGEPWPLPGHLVKITWDEGC